MKILRHKLQIRNLSSIAFLIFATFVTTDAAVGATEFFCAPAENGGLNDNRGNWELSKFTNLRSFLLRIDGVDSTLEDGVTESALKCASWNPFPQIVTCERMPGKYIVINTRTGKGGLASLIGATITPENRERDSMYVAQLNCSRR
jgi:hypothetical protein